MIKMICNVCILIKFFFCVVDIIGLFGFIIFFLDEMIYVVKEMERIGFKVFLLIGGVIILK